MKNLSEKHCQACEGGIPPLKDTEINDALNQLQNWEYDAKNKCIRKTFQFKGFLKTVSFVNAVAWIANTENHHPTVTFSFNTCAITYQTHAVDGLTENDFICAAKIDRLITEPRT